MSALLRDASIPDLTRGFTEEAHNYQCLGCGFQIEKGVVYPVGDVLYDALRCVQHHVQTRHGSPFDLLMAQGKDITGLSSIQRRLLEKSYQGWTDEALRAELGVGSTSTIRNHRAALREKERQARVFVAIMELLVQRPVAAPVDEILKKYFPDGQHLLRMPLKDKARRRVVEHVAERFEANRTYTEKEVNAVLSPIWSDIVLLRRYLIVYGYLDRKDDGSQYWRCTNTPGPQVEKEDEVDRKTELKREARTVKAVAGIYQIKSLRNGKSLVESTCNLKTMNGRQFGLEAGQHRNQALQRDWNEFGKAAFSFEVLETVAEDESDVAHALQQLLEKWVAKLQPVYNE